MDAGSLRQAVLTAGSLAAGLTSRRRKVNEVGWMRWELISNVSEFVGSKLGSFDWNV